MKILAIRGRNLASLAREFDVDLTADELGQSGIFAICGPVGAGKSTLLDALCLALFDRTPRLSGRGGVAVAELDRPETHWLHSHDPRSLLRRGAGEGHAEVDFTGRDGRRYRARWSVRRARRRGDGRVQQQEMSLEDLDRRIVVARANKSEVLLAIRARLGLDYGQFCRSVLLAQGQFAAFLRASADERAGLLESLTGADVYRRLSRAAHERRKLEQVEIDKLRAQVRGIELLDDGNRAGLEGEVTAMTEQVRVNQLAVDLAQSYVSWYASAAKLRNEESRATAALQLTIAANRAAAARRARLAELRCALPLVPRLELVAQCQQRVVTAVAAERALEAEVEVAEHELARHREARTAALRREFPGAASPPPVVVEFERWRAPLLRWGRLEAEWQRLGPPDG
ncbi:MAG: AAA family ATPase, partial [Planctomycetes bacterium]|nr:AAA family ATPase [Planctomycetota bacterium]